MSSFNEGIIAEFRENRGVVESHGFGSDLVLLHTTGAKSGEPRDAPLMYTPDGKGRAIVAGTSFARERHPAWTANLLAHPDAAITVRGKLMPVHATLIGDDEREAAWARIESQWPGYRNYERTSGRKVKLFRLQPVRG